MTTIHPTYNASKRLWRSDTHPPITGKTIRELLAKLPPGTVIKDYYPNGDTPIPPWPKKVDTKTPQLHLGFKKQTVSARPRTNYRTEVETEKEIIRLLSAGNTRREVCNALRVKMIDVTNASRKIDGGVR